MQLTRPKFFLYVFLRVYIFLLSKGVGRLPKVKGIFYSVYKKIKNKKGVVLINANNYRMYIDLADQVISTHLLQHGVWEEGVTKFVKKILSAGMTAVDCGAHVGYYSLLFSKLVKDGKVFSFEPDPYNFEILKQNIALNGCRNVVLEKLAISDKTGYAQFFLNEDNLGAHSIISQPNFKDRIEVKTIRLDDYFANWNAPIDLIKMDIEGAEFIALGGMPKIMQSGSLSIIMEFFPEMIIKNGGNPVELINRLRSAGMNLFIIHPETGNPEPANDARELINLCRGGLFNLFCTKKSYNP